MLPISTIRTRLLWLVLAVALPLATLLVWLQIQSERAAVQAVYARLSAVANARASFTAQYFEDQQQVLARMAQRPGIRQLNAKQCDAIITSYPQLHPDFTNLTLRDPKGDLVCSYLPNSVPRMTLQGLQVFGFDAAATPQSVSNVFIGPASKRQLVAITQVVDTQQGDGQGYLLLGNDLLKTNAHMFAGVPADITVGVFDRKGVIVFRSREPEKWIGEPIAAANRDIYTRQPDGQTVVTAVDGVRRMIAWSTIPSLGWGVTAGVAEAEAMGPYWQARNRALGLVGLLVLAGVVLAYRLSQSIDRPVRQLSETTQRMAGGDLSVRAPVSGPSELQALATQFNTMLDANAEARAELAANEARWKFAIEGSGDGLWDWDLATDTVFFSPRWKTMLGYAEHEVGNRSNEWSSRVHPDDTAAVMAELQPHLNGTTAQYASEFRFRCKDGSYKWILGRGLVVARDADGKPLRIVGTNSDITERKQEHEALRRSEEQYRELLNVSPVPCALNDTAQNITFVNRAFSNAFGYTLEDIPTLDAWWPRAYPDASYRQWVAEQWQERMAAMVAKGKPFEPLEVRIRCKDGTERTVLSSPAMLTNQTNGLHLVVLVDITERKQAQEALLENQAALKEAQRIAHVGSWRLEIASNHVTWSEELYLMQGLDPKGAPPNYTEHSKLFAPESWERLSVALPQTIETGVPYELELEMIKPDGSHGWMLARGEVLRDTHGAIVALQGTATDITERKLAQQALQASLHEKTALLMEVHHRVKNNLQIITSLLRLETRRITLPQAVDVLTAMQGRIRAMAQLHESLYRSGTLASIDLDSYVSQIATQTFRAHLQEGQHLQLKLQVEKVSASMDQALPCGLLVNELVSNCLKHGFPQAGAGEVCVTLQPANPASVASDGLWRLGVRDTGVGLPANFAQRSETSLGLQLVNDLSRQLRGTLEINAASPSGADFSVVFQVLVPQALLMPA